jgi:hypothetical protein
LCQPQIFSPGRVAFRPPRKEPLIKIKGGFSPLKSSLPIDVRDLYRGKKNVLLNRFASLARSASSQPLAYRVASKLHGGIFRM